MALHTFAAVCFDMDGVLIQSRQVIEHAWTCVAQRYGIAVSHTFIRDHIHGRSGEYTLERLFTDANPTACQHIQQEVNALQEASRCPLTPGVAALIAQLQGSGVPMALVTSSWAACVKHVLQQHALEGLFECVITREDVRRCKPAPDGYRLAAQRLHCLSDQCLVFEDAASGVKAAVSSGALCLGIGADASLVAHGAAALFADFNHLPIVRTPALIHSFDGSALLIGAQGVGA